VSPTSTRWQVGGHKLPLSKPIREQLAITKAAASVFTDSIPAAETAMDTSLHSGQEHFIVVSKLLRLHFTTHPEGSLHFWDYPGDAKWSIQVDVHYDATRTQYPVEERMRTSIDALSQKNSKAYLDEWTTEFLRGETRGRNFLMINTEEHKAATPTYAKGGTWMSHLGHSISLCARATRAILNYVPIGEYRARFFPQETCACPCGQSNIETKLHILTECLRFASDRITLPSPCIGDFIKFLTSNPFAFAFPIPREPP